MKCNIRKAKEEDIPKVFSLLRELADFEKSLNQVTTSVGRMRDEKDLFECFVFENEAGQIVAIALYSFAYDSWVGKSIFLNDLYVQEPYRSQGIGEELLQKVFAEARANGCAMLYCQVEAWNERAMHFYKKLGARVGEFPTCYFDLSEK